MKTFAVAQNTFREAVRDKVLYVLLFFAAAVILGSKAIGWISVGQDIKIVKDITLSAVLVFGVLISIFIGTNLVYKEIDKRTLYTILARPVRRYEFILGKYLGLALLLGLMTVIMTAVSAGYVLVLGGRPDPTFFMAAGLIYVEILLVIAMAILFGTLTSPILGALIVFTLFLLGHTTTILVDLPPQFDGTSVKKIMEIIYYAVPNLSNFNIRAEAANGVPISLWYVGWAVIYGLGYTVVLLIAASLFFENKDV